MLHVLHMCGRHAAMMTVSCLRCVIIKNGLNCIQHGAEEKRGNQTARKDLSVVADTELAAVKLVRGAVMDTAEYAAPDANFAGANFAIAGRNAAKAADTALLPGSEHQKISKKLSTHSIKCSARVSLRTSTWRPM